MSTSRNPEETKKKILEVAGQLFFENGYDNTSIQDIVNNLDGMTKGAIYHHFTSKFDILDTLIDNNYTKARDELPEGKNGLGNLKNMILMSLKSYHSQTIIYSAAVLLKSPRMIGEQYLSTLEVSSKVKEFMLQGIEDGSIITDYPEEVAEMLLLYMNMRIGLHLVDLSKEEYMRKIHFMKKMLDDFGVPVLDGEVVKEAEKLYDYLCKKK